MKKILSIMLACLMLTGLLAACGGAGGNTGSTADYKQLVEAVRPEGAEVMPIVTSPEEDASYGLIDFFGIKIEDMQKYAISVSLINIKAYGIAIVLPAEGKTQAVTDSMNAFVEAQKKAFDGYLEDQYTIAKDAQVKTMNTGEVVLVMCKDAPAVMGEIEKGLQG